jgi:hypothetical protein
MKKAKQAHVANSKYGSGDYYGTGIPPKMGKVIDMYSPNVNPVSPKALKKPPKKLA